MSRIVAAGHIRNLAFSGAEDVSRSRCLLTELSGLLKTYYRRGPDDAVERVGPAELCAWWAAYGSDLVAPHHDLARGYLRAAGVGPLAPARE